MEVSTSGAVAVATLFGRGLGRALLQADILSDRAAGTMSWSGLTVYLPLVLASIPALRGIAEDIG